MFNPYTLILGLFAAAGLATAIWGWTIIAKGRRSLGWPSVEGIIEQSEDRSEADDLLPHIRFRYTVGDQGYRRDVEFPPDITPTPELAASYRDKFPAGKAVVVYYDPAAPHNATLEPGPGRGDWLVFALGIGMFVFGVAFLAFGG